MVTTAKGKGVVLLNIAGKAVEGGFVMWGNHQRKVMKVVTVVLRKRDCVFRRISGM